MHFANRTIRALSLCALCAASCLAFSTPADALSINVSYDSSVSSAPTGFTSAVNTVASELSSMFTNPISINIDVGWGEVHGTTLSANNAGESIGYYYDNVSYNVVAHDLQLTDSAAGNSSVAQQAAQYIPGSSAITTNGLNISTAEAKAIGAVANSSSVDGYVGFSKNLAYSFDPSNPSPSGKYDFFGLAYHEITEVMGRTGFPTASSGSGTAQTPLDLFRYTANGTLDTASPNSKNYFSTDGGATALNYYNTVAGADYADWAGTTADALNAYIDPAGVFSPFSTTDLKLMNVLGYQTSATAYSTVAAASISPAVPEPTTLLLLGLGAVCTLGFRRKTFVA